MDFAIGRRVRMRLGNSSLSKTFSKISDTLVTLVDTLRARVSNPSFDLTL